MATRQFYWDTHLFLIDKSEERKILSQIQRQTVMDRHTTEKNNEPLTAPLRLWRGQWEYKQLCN